MEERTEKHRREINAEITEAGRAEDAERQSWIGSSRRMQSGIHELRAYKLFPRAARLVSPSIVLVEFAHGRHSNGIGLRERKQRGRVTKKRSEGTRHKSGRECDFKTSPKRTLKSVGRGTPSSHGLDLWAHPPTRKLSGALQALEDVDDFLPCLFGVINGHMLTLLRTLRGVASNALCRIDHGVIGNLEGFFGAIRGFYGNRL